MEFNIICDVGGNYDSFVSLIERMPKSAKVISVGDVIDRGPKSKQMLDWFMERPDEAEMLLGNHEHMMIDWFLGSKYYDRDVWFMNGGVHTLNSFGITDRDSPKLKELDNYLKFLHQRRMCILEDGVLITHASKDPTRSLEECMELGKGFVWGNDSRSDTSLIWNRGDPGRIDDVYQVFGHTGYGKDPYRFDDKQGEYAIAIDTSRHGFLTGIHWPSKEIYQQEIIEKIEK